MSAISTRISRLSFYIVRGRLLYTHSFQYTYRKKSGLVRSGYRTDHGIPDIYMKMAFVARWHATYSTGPLSLKRFRNDMTSSLSRRADSAFWNVSVGSAPRWIYYRAQQEIPRLIVNAYVYLYTYMDSLQRNSRTVHNLRNHKGIVTPFAFS